MQRLEVSGAVRHIYVIRRQRVNAVQGEMLVVRMIRKPPIPCAVRLHHFLMLQYIEVKNRVELYLCSPLGPLWLMKG
jgi:hypothetical protein